MQSKTDSAGRVFIMAQHLSPLDARFIKMRASLLAAGFAVSAAAPADAAVHPDARAVASTAPSAPGALGAFLRARARAAALARAASDTAPDVIITFDPEALPAAVAAKRMTGARLIYDAHEFHEDEAPDAPARGRWVKRTELRTATALDGFVTVNASIAALYARERPGFPAAVVVHNATPAAPAPMRDGRLRAAAGLNEAARVLLYHGGLRDLRGLNALVDAADLLPSPWRVVLMGDGPLASALRDRSPRTILLPPAPNAELPQWTADADLGAILYEDVGRNQRFATPNKLWEYPAAGVPILASDLPEIRAAVSNAQMGWLLPPNSDAAAVAKAVAALTPSQLAEASANARGFAQTHTWENEATPLIDLVRRLVG